MPVSSLCDELTQIARIYGCYGWEPQTSQAYAEQVLARCPDSGHVVEVLRNLSLSLGRMPEPRELIKAASPRAKSEWDVRMEQIREIDARRPHDQVLVGSEVVIAEPTERCPWRIVQREVRNPDGETTRGYTYALKAEPAPERARQFHWRSPEAAEFRAAWERYFGKPYKPKPQPEPEPPNDADLPF